MEALSLSPRVSKRLVYKLRAIRRCPFSLAGEYEKDFRGYIDALLDLDLISWQQWLSLSDLAVKVWESASRMNKKRINARFDDLILQCSPVEAVQDEPKQVSAPAAPGQLSVLGLLDETGAESPTAQRTDVASGLLGECFYVIELHDDIKPNRIDFPRLGKHWAPASLLVGYQERKGHSVLQA